MRSLCVLCGVVLGLVLASAASAQDIRTPPGKPQQQVWRAARAAGPAQLELLAQLVSVDTGTGEVVGGDKAVGLLAKRFLALGMTVRRSPAETPGLSDNLVATLAGTGRGRILLIGHVDTVFETGAAAARPFRIQDGRAYGPGVSDEKAGVVGGLFALQILHDLRRAPFKSLTFLIDTSEEKGSRGSRALVGQLAKESDVVLNLEPAQSPDGVVVWRKGSGVFQIEAKGRAAHAGVAPQDGRNAAVELLHQLEVLKTLPGVGEGLTANLTVLQSGGRTNIIPAGAAAAINVRALTLADFDRLQATLERNAQATLVPDTQVTVRLEPSFPPLPRNPDSDALAGRAQAIYRELGLPLEIGGNGGGSESALAFYAGVPVLDGLGPVGGGFHSEAEFLDLSSVTPRLYLLARLIEELGTRPPPARRPGPS